MISPAAAAASSEKLLCTILAASFSFFLILRALLSFKSLLFLLTRLYRWLENHTHSYQTFTIPSPENPLYRKVAAYIAALPAAEDSPHTSLFSLRTNPFLPNEFSIKLLPNQVVLDTFLGSRLSWTYNSGDLVLRLRRQDRHRVLRPYLCHIETVADEFELRRKELKIYTNAGVSAGDQRRWRSAPMTHPATFDTLAIDPELKDRVRADLELFLKGRSYYSRLGRVWKRSYLLHGPPGTGKSSFVAAMARFLCYDVYEVDLSRTYNTDLRSILLDTTPRSLILIEDFDRYLAGEKNENVSGVLCFMDGVFSCCAEERVMVFTISGEEAVMDMAVSRPGRVDMQIHFPLCDFAAFKTMASSYLGVRGHKLYALVEEGFQSGGRMSHAEIGEIMMANRGSPSRAIKSVITALQRSSSSVAAAAGVAEKVECCGEVVEMGKESGRDLRKLYGYIKMQSWGKKERKFQRVMD